MESIFRSLSSSGDFIINEFIMKLSLDKYENDQQIAEETLKILELIICDDQLKSAKVLIDCLCYIGKVIQCQIPWDTTPNNIIQRVVKIIKEEYYTLKTSGSDITDPKSCDSFAFNNFNDKEVDFSVLRTNVIEILAEQKAELEQCQELISTQGETKIHSDEIIMTCGFCPTVLGFLIKASKKRRFHTIVAEASPVYSGHKMAKLLSSASIQTTVIQDSAIFSMMSRVNKVIIGCKTVFCNGGIKTFLGASSLACAAKYYSVPLYVCTPTFKFSTEMMEEVKEFDSASSIVSNKQKDLLNEVNATIAKYDYVPPENVTSFITNNRGIAPSYVYRQVMELYHPSADDI